MVVTRGYWGGGNGEMLEIRYKLAVRICINSGDLMHSLGTIASNTVPTLYT